jgi:fluoride ion exporter CrcB/FEX
VFVALSLICWGLAAKTDANLRVWCLAALFAPAGALLRVFVAHQLNQPLPVRRFQIAHMLGHATQHAAVPQPHLSDVLFGAATTAEDPADFRGPSALPPIPELKEASGSNAHQKSWLWQPFVGTFIVNVSASTFSALLAMLSSRLSLSPVGWPRIVCSALAVGFCGCLSTASTFALELHSLHDSGHVWIAYCYGLGTVLACQTVGLSLNSFS